MLVYLKKHLKKELVLECLNYYEENDIFLKLDDNYYELKENLLNKKRITYWDVGNFIKDTRGSEFSFFKKYNPYLYKMYHNQKNNISDIEYHFNIDNSIFIRPNFQDNFIDKKLSKLINQNQDKKYLIIDLRQLSGGSIKNCANICNILLPKGDIFTQEFKNKRVTYTSDNNYHKFTNIFILVDKYTASSSEILAYALKTKLENCKLIGYKTHGKIVGQDIRTNKKQGFILSTVSFKWYIDKFSYETIEIIEPNNNDFIGTVNQEINNNCI